MHQRVSLSSYSFPAFWIWTLAWRLHRKACPVEVCYGHIYFQQKFVASQQVLKCTFTVITEEGFAHMSHAGHIVPMRKGTLPLAHLCAASVFSEACMVSALEAIKQWRDGEGALLLLEGPRQTVTQQP